MAWLVADDKVLTSVEVADDRAARRRGLLGRDGVDGALLLTPARAVHTVGMRFPIDVAHLDRDMVVLSVVTMPPNRIGRWRRRAQHVIEAEGGALRRWGVGPGTRLAVAP